MNTNYLIRLDDACPYMDNKKWSIIEDLLDRYGIKPLVGIIPANADTQTMIEQENPLFWEKVQQWVDKGWEIALHGYNHVYVTKEGGINPLWNRSEFAGLMIEEQREKIAMGVSVLTAHKIIPKYFFAPSHTFDENTLKALREESKIRIISDTYALKPYRKDDFIFIPCQIGHPQSVNLPGIFTICLHPNNMKEKQISEFEHFLEFHNKYIISFGDIDLKHIRSIRIVDRLFINTYFFICQIRKKIFR